MASSTKQPPKRAKVKQMPNQNGGVALEEPPSPPEAASPPETPFDSETQAPQPPIDDTPPAGEPFVRRPVGRPKVPGRMEFFDRVASIPMADWGTRVFMYLYCFEPICDEKVAGEKKYLIRYSQPILDEQAIMVDYGSGKYRLTLSNKKPQGMNGPPIETYDFEIYNLKYPPKIPRMVWKNDPRNRRWEALLPKEEPTPPAVPPAPNPLDAFGTFMDIQDRIEERIKPAQPAAAAAPEPVDPWSAAEKILNMRSENPMVAILQQQMADATKAVEAERERNFKAAEAAREREFKLQQQLLESRTAAAPASKGFLDQIIELASTAEKLEPVKKLFGGFFGSNGTGGTETVVRAGRTTAYDVIRDIASSPFGANLGQGLGILLAGLAASGAGSQNGHAPLSPGPAVVSGPSPNGTVPPAESEDMRTRRIAQTITQPMLYEFFLKDLTGDTFAERMFDMWPEDYVFVRKLGAEKIINLYKGFPPAWAIIAAKEPQFVEFIQEMCKWDPNEDEGPQPGGNEDDGVTDLEQEA